MLNEMILELSDKKILILGFGREGKATYSFLREKFSDKVLDVIDENIDLNAEENKVYLNDKNLSINKTSEYLEYLKDYDYVFKTPGISFKGKDITPFISKITSELDMFLKFFKKSVTIVGITGTKGKSTTSSMLYEAIKKSGKRVHFLGNIGKPIFSELDDIKENDIVVIEISSHQSQYISNSPSIGIILNVFEEHLDHYNSYDEYIDAKINVIKYQDKNDYSIYSKENRDLSKRLKNVSLNSNVIEIAYNDQDKFTYFDFDHERELLGKHNEYNIMVVLKICEILNLDKEIVKRAIYEFKPLEHRLEKVGTYNDITYYNDSISTIPETAIACINTINNINTIIIGGLDRGVEYEEFEKFLIDCYVENIICMYQTGKKIYDAISNKNKNVIYAEDLEQAVSIAKRITKKGMVCAMSPAAASYGYFKNFEERGKAFKELVAKN